jgi:non-canonical purine NTP pyrophosphatase (RdgB/HAM1 family)
MIGDFMTELLVATHNKGKLHEFAHILSGEDVKVLSLDDVDLGKFEVDETGNTYEDNSFLKAKTIGDKTHRITVADDSGIEVAALGGKPGVYSARYAKGSDADRCRKMLKELDGKDNRSAKFVAVVAYYDPTSQTKKIFRGECKGLIGKEMRGENGFGYDPLFIPEGFHQTMAELPSTTKNEISHRARALQAFATWWKSR